MLLLRLHVLTQSLPNKGSSHFIANALFTHPPTVPRRSLPAVAVPSAPSSARVNTPHSPRLHSARGVLLLECVSHQIEYVASRSSRTCEVVV